MTFNRGNVSRWLGAAAFAGLILAAGPAHASPIFSLNLSDGSKSDGADILSLSFGSSEAYLSGSLDSLTTLLFVDVATHKYFDWAVLTEYDGGTALSPGKRLGEYDFEKVLFTSVVLGGGGLLNPILANYSLIAGDVTFVPAGKDPKPIDTPEPASLALVGIGIGSAFLVRRRRTIAG